MIYDGFFKKGTSRTQFHLHVIINHVTQPCFKLPVFEERKIDFMGHCPFSPVLSSIDFSSPYSSKIKYVVIHTVCKKDQLKSMITEFVWHKFLHAISVQIWFIRRKKVSVLKANILERNKILYFSKRTFVCCFLKPHILTLVLNLDTKNLGISLFHLKIETELTLIY